MRLHLKLALSFGVILFVLFGLVAVLSMSLVTEKFDEESRRQTQATLEFLHDEYERLRQETSDDVATVARDPSLLSGLDALARGEWSVESPEMTYLGADLMARSRLDLLEVLDEKGTILTIGHWPVYAGHTDSSGLHLASLEEAQPRVATIRGERHLSVQAARPLEVGGRHFVLAGGKLLDERFVHRLEKAAGDEVLLYFVQGSEIIVSGRHPERRSLIPNDIIHYRWRWRQGSDSKDFFVTEVSSSGQRYSLGTAPLVDERNHIIGEILVRRSDQKLLELRRDLFFVFGALVLAGIALAGIAASLGARTITRPLAEFADAVAGAAATGAAPAPLPERGDAELVRLTRAWNTLGREMESGRARLARMERVAAWREAARRIAHEIRNALYPIRLAADTIERAHTQTSPRFGEVLANGVENVRSAVSDLQKIVDEFSAFARWPEPKRERCDLSALARRAADTAALEMGGGLGEPGVRLAVHLAEDLPAVDADPMQVSQLLTNLLRNARDAVGETGEVRVSTGRGAHGCWIEVADTGCGMPPEVLARAREPYFTSKPHGTGLGLAIAQQIVDAHGGEMHIASNEGVGTTVVVSLPPAARVALASAAP